MNKKKETQKSKLQTDNILHTELPKYNVIYLICNIIIQYVYASIYVDIIFIFISFCSNYKRKVCMYIKSILISVLSN